MTAQALEADVGNPSEGKRLSTLLVSQLRIGATLRQPVYDDRSVLLVAAGTTLTISLISRLRRRGIVSVRVQESELQYVSKSAAPPRRDEEPGDPASSTARSARELVRLGGGWDIGADSFIHRLRRHGARPYLETQLDKFDASFQQSVTQVEDLFESLAHRDRIAGDAVLAVSRDALTRMVEDLDLFVTLGIKPQGDGYPSRHAMQTAMLAMAVGTNLGLSYQQLMELGAGCLIHDVGMLNINRKTFRNDHQLGRFEFLEITKHPTVTFDLIRDLKDVPNGSRMVAYQMHERQDGSGYPRRRRGSQIHPLARIAGVADVFVAMVSPRPHRPGLLPYQAMEQILRGNQSGLYDPDVVRALLQTVSLFPLGSFVQISDGRIGRVVRTNGRDYMRPIIELWSPPSFTGPPRILDLQQQQHLKIDRPLPNIAPDGL